MTPQTLQSIVEAYKAEGKVMTLKRLNSKSQAFLAGAQDLARDVIVQ
jgi:hypothetical protein